MIDVLGVNCRIWQRDSGMIGSAGVAGGTARLLPGAGNASIFQSDGSPERR
jgi:hypothetical protein